jgi:hyaluronan synthase
VLTFEIQLTDMVLNHRWHYFVAFYLLVWLIWLTKLLVSRRYQPYAADYRTTASVVVPVVDEDPDHFRRVLASVVLNRPDEIVVVINGRRNPRLQAVCDELGVGWIHTEVPGKRNATIVGVRASCGDVVVLVDSDTLWERNTLRELLKPFRDPWIGGVTTHQRIFGRERNLISRFADWMEDIRATYSMPAMSVFGQVGCLPGRTIAFRRNIVVNNARRFLTERFLGIHLEISDDRTLTNYALQDGYRTVYQRTSRVSTDTPTELRRYVKQQYRWARGSQYNTLRMARFMVAHTPFLAFCFFTDILVPFAWVSTLVNVAWKVHLGEAVAYSPLSPLEQAFLVFGGTLLSFALRNVAHLRRHSDDWPYLPLFVLFLAGITLIRLYGFFRSGHDASWGTRRDAHRGQGQIHAKGNVPVLLGTLGLLAAIVIGPLSETPDQAVLAARAHATLIVGVLAVAALLLAADTGNRYRLTRQALRPAAGAGVPAKSRRQAVDRGPGGAVRPVALPGVRPEVRAAMRPAVHQWAPPVARPAVRPEPRPAFAGSAPAGWGVPVPRPPADVVARELVPPVSWAHRTQDEGSTRRVPVRSAAAPVPAGLLLLAAHAGGSPSPGRHRRASSRRHAR